MAEPPIYVCFWGKRDVTIKLVQPAFEVEQDVHLLTVKFFKREELGEVKLSILKEGNDNVCLECRDGHAHYNTRIIQLQTTADLPTVPARHIRELGYCPGQLIGVVFKDLQTGTPYQVGIHSSLKEKIRFDRRALFVSFLLQSRTPLSDEKPIANYRVKNLGVQPSDGGSLFVVKVPDGSLPQRRGEPFWQNFYQF